MPKKPTQKPKTKTQPPNPNQTPALFRKEVQKISETLNQENTQKSKQEILEIFKKLQKEHKDPEIQNAIHNASRWITTPKQNEMMIIHGTTNNNAVKAIKNSTRQGKKPKSLHTQRPEAIAKTTILHLNNQISKNRILQPKNQSQKLNTKKTTPKFEPINMEAINMKTSLPQKQNIG